MRKKLSILLAAVMLTLMSAVPGVAQVEPPQTVTVCALETLGLLFPDGTEIDLVAGQTAEIPDIDTLVPFLIQQGIVAEGPCPESGGGNGGDGGDNGNGGDGGGNGGGGATPITQEGAQESEAGEVDQSFDVS